MPLFDNIYITTYYLAYRLKGAEIRVGNSPNTAENELCTIIDKPKGIGWLALIKFWTAKALYNRNERKCTPNLQVSIR